MLSAFTFVIADFLVDKPCRPQKTLLTYALYLNVNDYFYIDLRSNQNVNIPRWYKYGNTSQLIKHTARQSLTLFCSYFISEISFYTYLQTIYIKFI